MEFISTELQDVYIIKCVRHGDERGYFSETFRKDEFEIVVGAVDFVQENESMSRRGVVRGLHYQAGDKAQAKLVRVTHGRVVDVAVDLRRNSTTYGHHIAVELSEENGLALYVPRGFAHGFMVLSETARFEYKVDNYYCPAAERCIRFDDPELAIEMQLPASEAIFSEKDRRGISFAEAEKF